MEDFMKLKRRVREIIAYVLVFAIIIGIMRQEGYAKAETQNDTTNAEYHSQECLIEYRTMGSWGNYANVNVSITNEGERKISLWELEFSYSSKIENIWNADVLSEGDGQLKIGAKTYNSVIEKGQTVSFGFTAHCESGQPEAPGQMTLTDEQSRKKAEQPEETPDRTETGEGGQSVLFPEKWKGLNYALFTSGENDLSLYTCRTNVIGDVHTNHSFYYQGTTLSLQGRLEAADRICLRTSSMENACRVTEQNEQAGLVRMPDITAELNEYVKENSESYESGKNFNSDSVFLKKLVYVNGDAAFHATRFRGQGVVYAKNSVTYNVGQIATYENARMFLASEQGDITLNGTDITLDAVLYAPNGCVTVNANNFHLNGRIIARQVCINGTTININAGDGDFDMLPFLLKPEVALTVSGNQKENRKIVIDVEELENTRYIIKENTVWEVTKDGEDAGDRFLVDGDASDEFHKECLFTEAGTYTVSVTVTTEKA